MCVNCELPVMDELPQLLAPSDSTQFGMNFQLSWLSFLEVRKMSEPYGPVLSRFINPEDLQVRKELVPGTYAAQVRIGNNSAGITHCILVIPQTRLVTPFVRYVVTSREHTY